MEEDIDQMKTPGFQAEYMVINHENDVHQGPVVVSAELRFETPDTFGKYLRYVPYILDPQIVHYQFFIVIYEIAKKGVEIYGTGKKQNDKNWNKRNYWRFLL